jgi:hypothetical protein
MILETAARNMRAMTNVILVSVLASTATAQFYFPNPSPPLGGNVVTNTEAISKSRPAKPEYLETFTDPYFGSKITRVSGDKGHLIPVIGGIWPQNCRNHYQKDPPWNADGSVLFLTKGCKMFLDGNTYKPLDLKTPSGPARFHPLKPDIMIVLPRNGNSIEQFNLAKGTSNIIATFSGYSGLSYMSEGNISGDGRWIAPYTIKNGKQVTFAYDMKEKKKYPDIDLAGWDIDWVSICFSGKYIVVNGKSTQNDITQIYESTTGREVGARWSSYGHPSHYDLGIDQNGEDVAVGIAKSSPNQGQCIMRRLKDGEEKALCSAGSHTGTRNTHRPGWAYIQSTHKGLYVDEVIAVELTWNSKPIVERLAYIPNVKVDYLSETHGAVSFDGKKFCAVSNWGIAGGQIQAYVVDISDICSSSTGINNDFPMNLAVKILGEEGRAQKTMTVAAE